MTALLLLLSYLLQSPGEPAYDRANALFVRQQFAESMAEVDESLRLDPKLVPALTLKAKIAMAGNRFDVARESLERALAADPKAFYAQFLYGLEAYLRNDVQAALPRFRRAHELSPGDSRATLYLGLTTESLGDTAAALALYLEAVRLGKSAATLLPLARLLLLLGRTPEAEVALRDAIRLEPQQRDPHFEMARLLLRKGDAATAVTEAELALTLGGGTITDSQLHYVLIRACRQSGQPECAAQHAEILRTLETPSRPR